MPKTIRELSEDLGVSKAAINKLLTPEKRQLFVNKIGNKFSISDEGVAFVEDHFNRNSDKREQNEVAEKEEQKEQQSLDFNQALLETLQNELKHKNEQIDQLNGQLGKVHTLLDQQQQLTLHANQQIESFEKQLQLATKPVEETEEATAETPTDSETPSATETEVAKKDKKHWWQF